MLASCVPWNLVAEVARRLSDEEASAREAAAKARQAAERAAQRGQDAGADEVAEKKAQSSAARWAAIRADLASEVRSKKIAPRLRAGPLTTGCFSSFRRSIYLQATAKGLGCRGFLPGSRCE